MTGGRWDEERVADLLARRATGETLQSLGDSYGVTRQRVQQILAQIGDPAPPRKPKSVKGEVYGSLTILAEAARDGYGRRHVLCRCTCGTEKIICLTNLLQGLTKGCGCRRGQPRLITINNRTQCLSAWLREVGLASRTVYLRVEAGLSIEEALLRPRQCGQRLDGRAKTRRGAER